jgi:hypothetical protein
MAMGLLALAAISASAEPQARGTVVFPYPVDAKYVVFEFQPGTVGVTRVFSTSPAGPIGFGTSVLFQGSVVISQPEVPNFPRGESSSYTVRMDFSPQRFGAQEQVGRDCMALAVSSLTLPTNTPRRFRLHVRFGNHTIRVERTATHVVTEGEVGDFWCEL